MEDKHQIFTEAFGVSVQPMPSLFVRQCLEIPSSQSIPDQSPESEHLGLGIVRVSPGAVRLLRNRSTYAYEPRGQMRRGFLTESCTSELN